MCYIPHKQCAYSTCTLHPHLCFILLCIRDSELRIQVACSAVLIRSPAPLGAVEAQYRLITVVLHPFHTQLNLAGDKQS